MKFSEQKLHSGGVDPSAALREGLQVEERGSEELKS